MTFTLQPRLFALLALAFVLATIIGTITHELGHIAVAKMQGYKTELHYASMNIIEGEREKELEVFYEKHKDKILSPESFAEKETFSAMMEESRERSIWITMGGPIQTLLTGTIGFILLWVNRKNIGSSLTTMQWCFVFLAFFWSRQIFNFLTGVVSFIFGGKWGGRGDETKISKYFDLPLWSINAILAIITSILLAIVVFRFIPKQQRFTFLLSGVVGSVLGFVFWMELLGPVILP